MLYIRRGLENMPPAPPPEPPPNPPRAKRGHIFPMSIFLKSLWKREKKVEVRAELANVVIQSRARGKQIRRY